MYSRQTVLEAKGRVLEYRSRDNHFRNILILRNILSDLEKWLNIEKSVNVLLIFPTQNLRKSHEFDNMK